MEAVLALSTRYANDRVLESGRPIAGFQAIEQQLAQLAEQAAAALVVVESAAVAVAAAWPSMARPAAAAKIRAGEAAGKVAEIAHQSARRDRLYARAQPPQPDLPPLVVAR